MILHNLDHNVFDNNHQKHLHKVLEWTLLLAQLLNLEYYHQQTDYQYYDLFKSLEMSKSEWERTRDKIHSNGQKLYFDVFGKESMSIAKEVFADGVKITTTDFYNNLYRIEYHPCPYTTGYLT